MALYLIGDVQGCDNALQALLDKISFSASRDTLYLLGDLVNRGPDSAGVLRRLMGLGASALTVLGNHDLHLLALAHGARQPRRSDTLSGILGAPDRAQMLEWLRAQPMALLKKVKSQDILLVHAGVLPAWTPASTVALAGEVEEVLRSAQAGEFFLDMYSNEPHVWSDTLMGTGRLRAIVNALTRLRFCDDRGSMEFDSKEGAGTAPAGYMPWFDVPGRQTADITVAFGHWSTLGRLERPGLISLDTGCVWGGCLSAYCLDSMQLIQVQCAQAQKPGLQSQD